MKKLLLSVFVFLPAILYGWTTPIDISQAPYGSHYADITCDRYDRIHVVWSDERTGNFEIVYLCCEGDSWGSIVNISNDSTQSLTPRVACDTLGNPHVLWVDWGTGFLSGELRYAYYDGKNWQEQINLSDTFSMPVSKAGIGTDTLNNIHIVWSSLIGIDEIYYSMNNGISWSVPATNISNNSEDDFFPSIAIGSKIYVVWMNRGTGASDSLEIYYSEYDTFWSVPVNVSNIVGQSLEPQITVDSQRKYPHVVWRESKGGSFVYYTSCNGDSWTTPYKILTGVDPEISLDSYNRVHIVYDWYDLHYIYYDGNTWSDSVMIWDSPVNALLPALTIDKSDCLYLVWTEAIDGDTSQINYSKYQLIGIEEELRVQSKKLKVKLLQNYPNPFSQKTKIVYILSESSEVGIIVYDLAGRVVKDFDLGCKPAGLHTFQLFPESFKEGGGIYFYRIKAGKYTATGKMVVVK